MSSLLVRGGRRLTGRIEPSANKNAVLPVLCATLLTDAPVRLRCATAAPCLPSAVRVELGMCAIVFLLLAADCAFLTLRRAVCVCFVVAMPQLYPVSPGASRCRGARAGTSGAPRGADWRLSAPRADGTGC